MNAGIDGLLALYLNFLVFKKFEIGSKSCLIENSRRLKFPQNTMGKKSKSVARKLEMKEEKQKKKVVISESSEVRGKCNDFYRPWGWVCTAGAMHDMHASIFARTYFLAAP